VWGFAERCEGREGREACVREGARRAGEEAETEANPPLTSTVKLFL
jgi:hypothetical protein